MIFFIVTMIIAAIIVAEFAFRGLDEIDGKTGQKAKVSGVYLCDACEEKIPLSKGETFPPCHGEAAKWFLIEET